MTPDSYGSLKERVFTKDHQDVIHWTKFYYERYQQASFIDSFTKRFPSNTFGKAVAVSSQWHRFSEFMPWLLCRCAANASSNIKRHYIIQGAYEELGMRDVNEIHADMFLGACLASGLTKTDMAAQNNYDPVTMILNDKSDKVCNNYNDARTLGVLLGLEIPAEEIVETLFSSLCHDASKQETLERTDFFTIHRQVESEHIRLAVSNFLRFCQADSEKKGFIQGFDESMQFWQDFWTAVGDLAAEIDTSDLAEAG